MPLPRSVCRGERGRSRSRVGGLTPRDVPYTRLGVADGTGPSQGLTNGCTLTTTTVHVTGIVPESLSPLKPRLVPESDPRPFGTPQGSCGVARSPLSRSSSPIAKTKPVVRRKGISAGPTSGRLYSLRCPRDVYLHERVWAEPRGHFDSFFHGPFLPVSRQPCSLRHTLRVPFHSHDCT